MRVSAAKGVNARTRAGISRPAKLDRDPIEPRILWDTPHLLLSNIVERIAIVELDRVENIVIRAARIRAGDCAWVVIAVVKPHVHA